MSNRPQLDDSQEFGALVHRQTFPFRPKPKQRPRMGGRRRVFTPKETIDFENMVRDTYDGPMFDGPVRVSVVFDTDSFDVEIVSVDLKRPKHVRSDMDNLLKAVVDGLQSKGKPGGDKPYVPGAFDNDRDVLSLHAEVAT